MLYIMCGQISKEGLFHRSRDAGGDAYDCHEAGRARNPGRRHCFWDEVEPFHCFWIGTEISAGRFAVLKSTKAPGARPKLKQQEIMKLVALLLKPAMDFGFESDLWTGPRVRVLIKREFGVKLHLNICHGSWLGSDWCGKHRSDGRWNKTTKQCLDGRDTFCPG